MKRTLALAVGAFAVAACSENSPLSPPTAERPTAPAMQIIDADISVSNSDDAGPGSFRDAIAQANANPGIRTIGFHPRVNTIELQSGVTFTGTQGLTINGNHATIDGANAGGTAFTTTKGGDLTLIGLTVRRALGQGVQVEVPPAATGTIHIALLDVDIIDNRGHGVLVNDQLDSRTEDGVQPVATGSAASLDVTVINSRFAGNGFSVSDRDGLRVNEGGIGDLTLELQNVRAEGNAADGVEIDERGVGNIYIDVSGTTFTKNGVFDPEDLDDGFDIDEYNDGSIIGTVVGSSAIRNYEEGFDFNENNAGDLRVNMTSIVARENGEEGVDLEEDDDFGGGGDLVTVMNDVKTFDNGDGADGGLKIREKEAGNLDVTLTNIQSSHNIGSGIFVRESSGGNAVIRLENVVSTANRAGTLDPFSLGHGIQMLESGAGSLTATVIDATTSTNAGYGMFADETGDGTGTVTVSRARGNANTLGAIGGTASFVFLP